MDLCSWVFMVLATVVVLLLLWIVWFLLFTDRDLTLTLAEKFGRPISVYRGKIVWVTGASSGLGEAMAYELASAGAKLILTARNVQRLMQVKNRCLEISQGELDERDILVLPFDITEYGIHKAKFDVIIKHFGTIDVLINNAGKGQLGLIEDTDIGVHPEIFGINFFGGASLTKLVVEHFRNTGNGQIIVISSIAGKFVVPALGLYGATKRALHGFYETLRLEVIKSNIHITIVCPGFFQSEIFSSVIGARKGEVLKDLTMNQEKIMDVSRCAFLTLVASANRLHEVWISYQPLLLAVWSREYFPILYKLVYPLFYTKKEIAEASQGRFHTDQLTWKPLFY